MTHLLKDNKKRARIETLTRHQIANHTLNDYEPDVNAELVRDIVGFVFLLVGLAALVIWLNLNFSGGGFHVGV